LIMFSFAFSLQLTLLRRIRWSDANVFVWLEASSSVGVRPRCQVVLRRSAWQLLYAHPLEKNLSGSSNQKRSMQGALARFFFGRSRRKSVHQTYSSSRWRKIRPKRLVARYKPWRNWRQTNVQKCSRTSDAWASRDEDRPNQGISKGFCRLLSGTKSGCDEAPQTWRRLRGYNGRLLERPDQEHALSIHLFPTGAHSVFLSKQMGGFLPWYTARWSNSYGHLSRPLRHLQIRLFDLHHQAKSSNFHLRRCVSIQVPVPGNEIPEKSRAPHLDLDRLLFLLSRNHQRQKGILSTKLLYHHPSLRRAFAILKIKWDEE